MVATVADILASTLKHHGVKRIFGQSVPTALLLRTPSFGIEQVAYRTENAGGAMADGYARVSGRVGIVTAQNGPGAALLVAPFAEALKASSPVVGLVQDVARPSVDRNAFQELDHIELYKSCTKWVRRLTDPRRAAEYLDMAVVAATSGRPGPTVLLLPIDLLEEEAGSVQTGRSGLGSYPLDRPQADGQLVAEAASLLAAAKRPIVVAGGGVHLSGAAAEVTVLQERFHLPIATTTMGKGSVDEQVDLSIGVIGYFMGTFSRSHYMRSIVDSADVILMVGSRTNQNGTDGWKLFPRDARFIHVDVDPVEVGRNYESLRLVGDARSTLRALIRELGTRDVAPLAAWGDECAKLVREAKRRNAAESLSVVESEVVPIRPERVMAELDRLLPNQAIVVADASYSTIWAANYLTSRRPGQRFITPRGLAGLGWGLPMGLGAKVASPEVPVVVVSGDGGFGHCWSEMETAVRSRIPIVHIVLNNSVLGYQQHGELVNWGAHTSAVRFAPVDHAKIAEACGARATRVERPGQLRSALESALGQAEPYLVDVVVSAGAYPPITAFEGKVPDRT